MTSTHPPASFNASPGLGRPSTLRPPALQGVKVVDFSHFVAGPLASQVLADWGADVVKIENPQRGDEFRHYPPYDERLDGEGCPFLWANRNKRSLSIDLKAQEGIAIVRELIRDADVVLENFSTGVMERLGLDYATVSAQNPRLVYCSVSAYGRDGACADRLGFDPVVQAESGFISMNGYADREGVRAGPVVMDIGTALITANAILLGLFERERSGKGQQVETALFDSAMTMVGYASYQSLFNELVPGRYGNSSPDTSPTGVFYASDGPLYIACTSTPSYQRLFTLIGRPDLANDEALMSKSARLERREELFTALNAALARDTRENWQALFRAHRVPSGVVRTVDEAIASEESIARSLFSKIPHPIAGEIPNLRSPIRMQASAAAEPVAAPRLGEHSKDVLTEMGYSSEHIAALQAKGVVRSGR